MQAASVSVRRNKAEAIVGYSISNSEWSDTPGFSLLMTLTPWFDARDGGHRLYVRGHGLGDGYKVWFQIPEDLSDDLTLHYSMPYDIYRDESVREAEAKRIGFAPGEALHGGNGGSAWAEELASRVGEVVTAVAVKEEMEQWSAYQRPSKKMAKVAAKMTGTGENRRAIPRDDEVVSHD
jgi:hypothetical protein